MRCLIITPYSGRLGGVESVNYVLEKALTNLNYKCEYLTLNDLSINLFYKVLSFLFGAPILTTIEFYKKNNVNEYDLIVCNGEFGFLIYNKNKIINLHHGSYYGYSKALKNNRTFKQTLLHLRGAFLQKIATHKKINVAVSSSVKTVLENQNIKVDYVLPNAVIDDRFDVHKQEKTRRNGKILLVTSNNYYAKGMDIVDEIISKFGYSIDYASPTENKKTLANYIGHLSKDELIDAYSKYSFVILPSRFEGMSMAIIESCMTGTPFLTSKVGHWLEVSNYCPDFIVEENKPEFFDAKFKLLASDFEKYSNVARNIYDNEHTLTIYQDRVENILLGIDYGAK